MPWDGNGYTPPEPPPDDMHGYISGTRRAIRGITYLFAAAVIGLVIALTTH